MAEGYVLEYDGPDSPKGKFWSIEVAPDEKGLLIKYGARGSKPRTAFVPVSKYRKASHGEEIRERRNDKLDEGYRIVENLPNEQPSSTQDNRPVSQAVAYVSVTLPLTEPNTVLSVFAERRYANGSGKVIAKDGSLVMTGRLAGSGETETVKVDLMSYEVGRGQQTLGLASAYMAQHFPESFHLADDEGMELSPLEMAELFESDRDVLGQLGIIQVFHATESKSLGEWFF